MKDVNHKNGTKDIQTKEGINSRAQLPKSTMNSIRGDENIAEKDKSKEVSINWDGYPDGPKPNPPFHLLEGKELENNRKLANYTNHKLHMNNPDFDGMQIHEIKPVKFGGSPTDIQNKLVVTEEDHQAYTRFWNKEQARIEEAMRAGKDNE